MAAAIPHKFYFGQSMCCLNFRIFNVFTECRNFHYIFSLWDDRIGEFQVRLITRMRAVGLLTIHLQSSITVSEGPTYHLRQNRLPFCGFRWHAFPWCGSACPQSGCTSRSGASVCGYGLLERRESNARSICGWLAAHWRSSWSGPRWLLFVS